MKKVYPIFIFVFFACLIWAQSLYALYETKYVYEYYEPNPKPENAKISPWGEIKLQYDDNMFLDSSNEKSDLIVTLTPGITAYLPFSDNLLTFDYHVDFIRFMDYSSQNTTNHNVFGNLQLNWRDVTFNIYDNFIRTFDRPSTEDVSRVKRDDNRAGITAGVQKDRLGIQIGYENFRRDYKSDPVYDQYDRTDHRYSFMVTHQTFPKTKLLLEYDFNQTRYDNNTARSDSDYHQILVGAIGNLTQKTTATIKTGYQFRNYEQTSHPDFNSWVLYSDIVHTFSDKNALTLSLSKTAEESTYGANNYYDVTSASGTFDHFFTPKLLGFITGLYQIHSYPIETTESGITQKRKDEYYSLGVGLKYYLQKWLTLTLHLEHIIRDSNFSTFDYTQNLVTLSAKAVF